MDTQKYKELVRYRSMTEALVTKAMLDSAGIPNQVMNDMIYGTVPSGNSGVRIIVNESDFDRAKEMLGSTFDAEELKNAENIE